MSQTRQYTIKVKAEKETTALEEVQKGIRGIMSVLMIINAPLRIYHMLMRNVHAIQALLGPATAASVGPITAQSGAFAGQTAALIAVNTALRQYIILMAMATQGASLAGATAGGVAAGALVAGASVATAPMYALAQTHAGSYGMVARGGAAIVHAGETIGRGGGFGGTVTITNNITLDPGGMDFTDFTSKMNEQFRLALRGHVKSIPG